MKRKKIYRIKPPLPYSLTLIRGGIGKAFVIKHYNYGAIKTRFPDMKNIIASVKQRKCRDLFNEAVQYAKTVNADPFQVAAFEKRIGSRRKVFNAAIKYFMLKEKRTNERQMNWVNRVIWNAMNSDDAKKINFISDNIISMDTNTPIEKDCNQIESS